MTNYLPQASQDKGHRLLLQSEQRWFVVLLAMGHGRHTEA